MSSKMALERLRKYLHIKYTVELTDCCLVCVCPECNRFMHDKRKELDITRFHQWGAQLRKAGYRHNFCTKGEMCTECQKNLENFCGLDTCYWCGKLKNARYVKETCLDFLEPLVFDEEGKHVTGYELYRLDEFSYQKICLSCNNVFMGIWHRQLHCEENAKLIRKLEKEIASCKSKLKQQAI